MEQPFLLVQATQHAGTDGAAVTFWHAFFAAEIPYLTHFLSAYDEDGGPQLRDAIVLDMLEHQVAFLRSLHQAGPYATFDLRFYYDPGRRRTRVLLLVKATGAERSDAEIRARQVWRHTQASFPHQLYPLRPLSGGKGKDELEEFLAFPGPDGDFAEMRRHERQEHLELGMTGYALYPLQGSVNGLAHLFRFLAAQDRPYLVSVALRPTELEDAERDLLGAVASTLREQARRTEQAVTTSTEMVSIPAGDLADLYSLYLRRLLNPFLFRLSVAAEKTIDTGLLSAILQDISQPFEIEGRRVPNRPGDFREPSGSSERQLAWFNLRYLELFDWLPRDTQPLHAEMARLRNLVDAEAANSIFRLPIPPIGGLPGIDSRPPSLFEPLPEHMRFPPPELPTLNLGGVHLEVRQLTQHALVAGTIGSGKTNTAVQILHKLWTEHRVPFLVLEPVNAEHDDYRSLGRYFPVPEELRIFTLGDESTSPFRWNPFEVPHGVILNSHVSGLMACFVAALPMGDGPLPSLFREALRNIYFAKGWTGDDRGGEQDLEIPNLAELRDELDWLIRSRYGEKSEVAQTLVGASVTRVNALLNSSAGKILMARRSMPLEELFDRPTILELRHLGSDEDKALMTGFLLLGLQEFCDRNRPVGGGKLHHVVLLEEAHNLMEEPRPGTADDAKAAAVRFFTNMLAENRKYGQGFLIVEQIPTLLAQGALKNSVVKVMHRMAGPDDIAVMGATMNFKTRHAARAVALKPREGEAFFYADGLNEATLIHVDYFAKDEPLSDREVTAAMAAFREAHAELYATDLPFAGCKFCDAPCTYRPHVLRLGYDRELGAKVRTAFAKANPKDRDQAVRTLSAPIRNAVLALGIGDLDETGATYCAFLHLRSQVEKLQLIADVGDFLRRLTAQSDKV